MLIYASGRFQEIFAQYCTFAAILYEWLIVLGKLLLFLFHYL